MWGSSEILENSFIFFEFLWKRIILLRLGSYRIIFFFLFIIIIFFGGKRKKKQILLDL